MISGGSKRQLADSGRGGSIGLYLIGRKIESAYPTNTGWLMLRFHDGHEAKVGYQDAKGNRVATEPVVNGARSTVHPGKMQGRVVDAFLTDGSQCIVTFEGGGETWFFWRDADGEPSRGEPFLENMDVRVILPSASTKAKGLLLAPIRRHS